MKEVRLIQQGDVLFKEVSKLPAGTVQDNSVDSRGVVFAEGEVTGHYHGTSTPGITMFRKGDVRFALVERPKEVTHQEHGAVTLDPGIYEIGIVREIDPFSEEINRVRD